MSRMLGKNVPESNGPVSHQDEFWSDMKLDELTENLKRENQHVVNFEQDARQPRLTMVVDVKVDKKTHERTAGATTAVQAMHGDSVSANRVDSDPKRSTSFGDDSPGPPALPCSRDGALVGNGAAAPKSCLSPLEMRSPTAAGGLRPAVKASTATRITFCQPRFRFFANEETNSERTSTQYALYYTSSSWWNQLPAPSWRRVIQIKSRQNMVFDPGGWTGRLHACPFLGTWRAPLCGEVIVRGLHEAAAFSGGRITTES